MPVEALMLALVVIGGACFGVIVGRVLTMRTRTVVPAEPIAPVENPIFPVRELEAVLAPYKPAA
jgi:hypothetical protein